MKTPPKKHAISYAPAIPCAHLLIARAMNVKPMTVTVVRFIRCVPFSTNNEYGREMKASMIVEVCAILECSPSWLLGISEEGEHLPPESPLLKRLKEAFDILNNKGQKKVVGYAEDLTGNVEYTMAIKKKPADSEDPSEKVEGAA